MQLITIEQIEVGDEIVISTNAKLKYLKVLNKPVLKRNNGWRRHINPDGTIEHRYDAPVYSSVRCTTRQESYVFKSVWGKDIKRNYFVYEPDINKHNVRINVDLRGRDILLIRREQE